MGHNFVRRMLSRTSIILGDGPHRAARPVSVCDGAGQANQHSDQLGAEIVHVAQIDHEIHELFRLELAL